MTKILISHQSPDTSINDIEWQELREIQPMKNVWINTGDICVFGSITVTEVTPQNTPSSASTTDPAPV